MRNVVSRLRKLNEKRLLRRTSRSVNLGDLIDSNTALQIIQQNGNGFNMEYLKGDLSMGGEESILGLISDDKDVAAELYCFRRHDGQFKGFVVAAPLIVDYENETYQLGSFDCICLNPELDDNRTLSQLTSVFKSGIDICGKHCEFQQNITDINSIFE